MNDLALLRAIIRFMAGPVPSVQPPSPSLGPMFMISAAGAVVRVAPNLFQPAAARLKLAADAFGGSPLAAGS
jgi:hypothetical protein